MPNNNTPTRNEAWRNKIKTSMLVNRLYDNALGKIDLTPMQIKSIEILLKKLIPDLKQIDMGGQEDNPVKIVVNRSPMKELN